jgi:hypothetical protein
VPSQQPDGQLQKQHNVQTQITTDNEQDKNNNNNNNNNNKMNSWIFKRVRLSSCVKAALWLAL